jgi:hypothetical protein
MKRTNQILDAVRYAARNRYAWPGGYPLVVVMSDGECLCTSCTRKQWRQIVRNTLSSIRKGADVSWIAAGADVNWENPDLYCAHCGDRIESAYAEK